MRTQTDLTARTFRSALVGLCKGCTVYVEPYEAGEDCPQMCERPLSTAWGQNYRTLARRRMLICSECLTCFPNRKDADEHVCEEYLP